MRRTPPSLDFLTAFRPSLFGLFFAVVLLLSEQKATRPEMPSPFAATLLAVLVGCLVSVALNLPTLLKAPLPQRSTLKNILATGALLSFAVFFLLLGVALQADAMTAIVFFSAAPIVTLLGRKILWGEALTGIQRLGVMMSLVSVGLWLLVDPQSLRPGRIPLPATVNAAFFGNASMFLSAVVLGSASSLSRPADYQMPAGAYWTWAACAAAVVAVPLMIGSHIFVFGAQASFLGVEKAEIAHSPWLLFPALAAGASLIGLRHGLLAGASRWLSAGSVACLWCFAALLAASILGCLADIHFVPLVLFSFPLHMIGLFLARNVAAPMSRYKGPKEAPRLRNVA